jgi:hypothetical protein
MSLRKAINQNCKDCVYDEIAAGTWRQQVTLCSAKSCALYAVRPKSTRPIPESVLSYYGAENDQYQDKDAL